MSKPNEETYKATFALMCAGMAIDMGWSMEETLELVRLGFEVKQSGPLEAELNSSRPSSLPPQ